MCLPKDQNMEAFGELYSETLDQGAPVGRRITVSFEASLNYIVLGQPGLLKETLSQKPK